MTSKLMNFVDQCGALELSDTFSFTLDDIKRLESLIRADQRATDAALAYNFPFSPKIGQTIAELIRCWRDDRNGHQTDALSLYENPVQGQTR